MVKVKRFLVIIFTFLWTVCCGIFFSGCNNEEDPNRKYDVTIRVGCDNGQTWVFEPNVKEITTAMIYDGEEHRFYIDAYRLDGHPTLGGQWLTPTGEGANVFSLDMLYTDIYGNQDGTLRKVKEKGEYAIIIEARATSVLWNYRSIILFVTIN
jgi:hypothetical protein